LRKALKPRGLTFITRQSRSTGKAPRCSSTNLNLTAFGSRRTGWLFLGCPSPPSGYGPHDEVVRSTGSAEITAVPRCALTHLFKVEKPTPRSSATWRRESPLVSAIRTASLRNSSVLPVLMVHPLCCTICDQRSGTKPGQVQTLRQVYRTRDEARADVFDYIERFYNPRRRHSKLAYLSPMEFEARAMLA